jgi:hypothetical protein
MKTMKLGKHPPKFDTRTLMFGAYLTKELLPPPASVDYAKPVKNWPMMGNDAYGDCTCAAAGHMIEEWTANTGKAEIVPDAEILATYNHFAHGNADAGANMLDVLRYWRKTGVGGDKIHAFAQLEPKNNTQARDAINLFGNCYIGVALPNFAVAPGTDFLQTPWAVPPQGLVGDAKPNPDNGHCVPAVAYDQRNLYVVTWGAEIHELAILRCVHGRSVCSPQHRLDQQETRQGTPRIESRGAATGPVNGHGSLIHPEQLERIRQ